MFDFSYKLQQLHKFYYSLLTLFICFNWHRTIWRKKTIVPRNKKTKRNWSSFIKMPFRITAFCTLIYTFFWIYFKSKKKNVLKNILLVFAYIQSRLKFNVVISPTTESFSYSGGMEWNEWNFILIFVSSCISLFNSFEKWTCSSGKWLMEIL